MLAKEIDPRGLRKEDAKIRSQAAKTVVSLEHTRVSIPEHTGHMVATALFFYERVWVKSLVTKSAFCLSLGI